MTCCGLLCSVSNPYVFLIFSYRVEHARMHAKHRGHEAMHAEMVLILIATLVVAQLLLVQWKQRHTRSYNVRDLEPQNSVSSLYLFYYY